MTQEEKSQAYDEALKQATKELQTCGSLDCDAARQIFRLFPQLRESEDEKIRKELLSFIESVQHSYLCATDRREKWIAYLAKQKESLHIHETCKENADSFTDKDERIRKYLIEELKAAKSVGELKFIIQQPTREECIAYLEKQKINPEEPKIAFGDWGDKEKKEAIITCLQYMRFIKKITNQEYDDLTKWLDNNLVYNLEIPAGDVTPEEDGSFNEDKFLERELSAFLQNYDKEYDDDAAVSDVARHFYEIGKKQKEQKPADDRAFEEWIDDWWKHNKVNNPESYDKGDEIQFDEKGFKNFCRGIRNMYAEQKPVVTHGETYHVDTLGTQQVIAGKMPYKPEKKHDLVAQLKEHLANTPKEQLEAEWKELEHWNNIGPTVEEYLRNIKSAECKATINGEPISTENQSVDIPLAEWSEEDEASYNAFMCEVVNEKMNPTIEQIKWLRGIRDKLKSFHPIKQEWSKEDEDFINMLILHFNYLIDKGGDSVETYKSYIKKLKSLRPSWKPSEEQMRALAHAINLDVYDAKRYGLESLYNDLKKLI